MTLRLSTPPVGYSAEDQARLRDALKIADDQNYKRGRDLELGFVTNSAGVIVPARFILQDEATGARTNIRLINGVLTPTAI